MQTEKAQTCAPEEQARRMFRAVLAPWAMDLLELRRRGLDRPGRRYSCGLVLRPGSDGPAAPAERPVRRAA